MEYKKFKEQGEIKDYVASVVARGKLAPIIDFVFHDDLSGPKQNIFVEKEATMNNLWVGSPGGMLEFLGLISKENNLTDISEVVYACSFRGGESYLFGKDLNELKSHLSTMVKGDDLHASIVVIMLNEKEGEVKIYGQMNLNVSPNYYILNYEDIKKGIIIKEAIKSSLVDFTWKMISDLEKSKKKNGKISFEDIISSVKDLKTFS